MELTDLEKVVRVALAAGLGAALGIEREVQHKTAGLRTHTLVAAGAALFAVAGASVSADGTDLTRIAAQVVTGIGFIGAGGMIKTGFTITGITTAATLWFAAALGVAAGFGLFVVATVSLAVALVAMLGFAPARNYIRRGKVQPLQIEYQVGHGTLTPLFETLNAIGAQVQRISMIEDEGKRRMSCELVGVGPEAMDGIIVSLRGRDEAIKVVGSPWVDSRHPALNPTLSHGLGLSADSHNRQGDLYGAGAPNSIAAPITRSGSITRNSPISA